jgi:hypothetical protein
MLHVSQYMYQDCSYNLVGDPIYAKQKRDPVTRCKEINVETNEAMAIKSEVWADLQDQADNNQPLTTLIYLVRV